MRNPGSLFKTLRRRVRVVLASITAIAAIASPVLVDASSYTYQPPGTAILCTGGDTTKPTLGQYYQRVGPQAFASLPITQQAFLNNIYVGTTCSHSLHGTSTLPATNKSTGEQLPVSRTISANIQCSPGALCASYSSVPFGYCLPVQNGNTLGSDAYPSCVSGQTILNVTFGFGNYSFYGTDQLENDVSYAGDAPGWTAPTNYSYHDNNGNVWQMATFSYTDTYPDNHVGYGTEAYGNGTYSFGPICGISFPPDLSQLPPNCDPMTISKAITEAVHLGYAATSTPFTDPTYYFPATYWCFYTDYSYSPFVISGGYCSSP